MKLFQFCLHQSNTNAADTKRSEESMTTQVTFDMCHLDDMLHATTTDI